MFLVDTNVWLERLLEQEKSDEVKIFLDKIELSKIFISDFTLHSIGVIMGRLNSIKSFIIFIEDLFQNGSIKIVSLSPIELIKVVTIIKDKKLDFDDAYQQCLSSKLNLELVTFDKDFIQSGFPTITPTEALILYKSTKNLH